ncbi:MAG: hypothetical protein A3A12_00070 [Candidatus Staskawiczbacteria bacterium RIFCSPLOWO2_01_FULL_43_17b]|nr:MAG: hypothetical protein A3A12_00070 [Candidatus Staskawiczbacteria bacterium RIFCSPLOWO2_01_FULL_43_17b]
MATNGINAESTKPAVATEAILRMFFVFMNLRSEAKGALANTYPRLLFFIIKWDLEIHLENQAKIYNIPCGLIFAGYLARIYFLILN